MISVREAIEQAIVLSIGAASLTRERVEGVVGEFVKKGQLGAEEGRAVVDRVMSRVRAEGAPGAGVAGRAQEGMQSVLRGLDVARRADVTDLEMRIAALEHRVRLLEGAGGADDASAPSNEG